MARILSPANAPWPPLALENTELPCVGVEREAVQVCLAASNRDLFLVGVPVGQLVDRKYQRARNRKAMPLPDAVGLGDQRRQTRVRSK